MYRNPDNHFSGSLLSQDHTNDARYQHGHKQIYAASLTTQIIPILAEDSQTFHRCAFFL